MLINRPSNIYRLIVKIDDDEHYDIITIIRISFIIIIVVNHINDDDILIKSLRYFRFASSFT
jgi:hypothetical protein